MAKSNPGVARLLSAMKKLSIEVNDQEICRRLEILMGSEKDDLSASLLKRIFETPDDIEPRDISEPYTQYVMHYLYMLKREKRNQSKKEDDSASRASTRKK